MSKDTIILTNKAGKPFVVKKTKYYYVDGVKYTDDIKILLNAIKQVKEVKYDDMFKPEHKGNKQDYWNVHFNYQWSGGGLILWNNPTDMWEQELARNNKLTCKVCGTTMQMYYVVYCPICDRAKQKRQSLPTYNFMQMIDFIEAKHKIDIRNYYSSKHGIKCMFTENIKRQNNWEADHYPLIKKFMENPKEGYSFSQEGIDYSKTADGSKFFTDVHYAYMNAPDGKCKEIPYWDWWHLFTDCYEFSNDTKITINFGYIMNRSFCNWQKEITQMFIDEYGTKDIEVEISW